jgi:hypothetical protein
MRLMYHEPRDPQPHDFALYIERDPDYEPPSPRAWPLPRTSTHTHTHTHTHTDTHRPETTRTLVGRRPPRRPRSGRKRRKSATYARHDRTIDSTNYTATWKNLAPAYLHEPSFRNLEFLLLGPLSLARIFLNYENVRRPATDGDELFS